MNRDNFTRRDIDLDNLQLGLQNPRIISGCRNEVDCLKALLRNPRNEILNLAKHIADNGIGIFPIVVMKKDSHWVVCDGNRRIAALKMLKDPNKCPDEFLQKRFANICDGASIEIPHRIECYVADNSTAVSKHIFLIHEGKQEGVGLSSWTPYVAARNAVRDGRPSAYAKAIKLLMWGEKEGVIQEVEETFAITNLARLIRFSKILNLMRFEFDVNEIPRHLDKKQDAKKILSRVYNDIKNGEIKARNIENNENAIRYIQEVLSDLSIAREATQETVEVVPAIAERQREFTSPATNKESWILKNDFRILNLSMPADETKARDIAKELAYKTFLNIERAPNAAAVLARTFIELSLNHYLLKHEIVSSDAIRGMVIKQRADKVINDQWKKNIINKNFVEFYKKFFKDNGMVSLKTMHAYTHSKEEHPSPTDLRTIWKNIRMLIINCWKH